MSSYFDIITNKKNIIFSDHSYKSEILVCDTLDKMFNAHKYCFIISSKKYNYNRVKYYTAYEIAIATIDNTIVTCQFFTTNTFYRSINISTIHTFIHVI
jgi:hypothetical protein